MIPKYSVEFYLLKQKGKGMVLRKILLCLSVCVFVSGAAWGMHDGRANEHYYLQESGCCSCVAYGTLHYENSRVDEEVNNEVDEWGEDGFTRLMSAASFNDLAEIDVLLERKAAVDLQREKDGQTALHCVAQAGHTKAMQKLIDVQANVNKSDYFGDTPCNAGATALMHAADKGKEQVVTLLLENKASVSIVDKEQRNASMYAQTKGYDAIAQRLLEIAEREHE